MLIQQRWHYLVAGGAPIEKYIIEKMGKDGEWTFGVEIPNGETKGTVPGLTYGETYKFRVKAVNKVGPGEPSNTTDPVTCKPRRRKLPV